MAETASRERLNDCSCECTHLETKWIRVWVRCCASAVAVMALRLIAVCKKSQETRNTDHEIGTVAIVFDSATPQDTIDAIISSGNFTVDFSYPNPPPLLYKLDVLPNMDLQDAHTYLRGFSSVLAAASCGAVFLPETTTFSAYTS